MRAVTVNNLTFLVRPEPAHDSFVLDEIFKDNCYRIPEDIRGKVVVDLGANIGAFSILCAQKGAIVYAYEPQPENNACLQTNVALNNFHCTVFDKAVGTPGTAAISDNTGGSSIVPWIKEAYGDNNPQEITVIGLDEALQDLESVYFLKIDTEGAEFDIIRSASSETLQKITFLTMEIHQPFQKDLLGEMFEKLLWFFNIEIEGGLVFCTPRKTE